MAALKNYVVTMERGEGINMDTCKISRTVHFQVAHTDGMVAWRGQSYYESYAQGRTLNGIRLQASKQAHNLEAYFERTGNRWEVEQKAERDAKAAGKKAEQEKRERMRAAAPRMLQLLMDIVSRERLTQAALMEAEKLVSEIVSK